MFAICFQAGQNIHNISSCITQENSISFQIHNSKWYRIHVTLDQIFICIIIWDYYFTIVIVL